MPLSCLEGSSSSMYFSVCLLLYGLDARWQVELEILVSNYYQE